MNHHNLSAHPRCIYCCYKSNISIIVHMKTLTCLFLSDNNYSNTRKSENTSHSMMITTHILLKIKSQKNTFRLIRTCWVYCIKIVACFLLLLLFFWGLLATCSTDAFKCCVFYFILFFCFCLRKRIL